MSDFSTFFSGVSAPWLEPSRIERDWLALRDAYDVNRWKLPLPFWGQRGYDDSGSQAWETAQIEASACPGDRPLSMYLHVPFCSSKCGFCDSYSFALSPSRQAEKEAYVDRLCSELALWGRTHSLTCRPVTTVHLGGGTPTYLGEELLSRLVYTCMDLYGTGPQTEWALELNTTSLTPGMIARLQALGFRRLHLGVQSLEDGVRRVSGRRQPSAAVLDVIGQALQLGWVVSVDLIVGLPGQTLPGVLSGIQALIDLGVHGFSLYELLIYPQNSKWAGRHHLLERDHLPNYWMFQAGAQLLEAQGFRKNLFNHWAAPQDQNVYFTFPLRGEDLLAAGCLADGVFGSYHYRHHGYDEYCSGSSLPGLAGGLCQNALEQRLSPLILAVQSGRISAERAREINGLGGLIERWQAHGLLAQDNAGSYSLTSSGSWFAGNMIAELGAAA